MYDKFFFNYGYVYNTHSGFFTAPSARLYIFTWTSIFAPWKIIDAKILVNGKRKGLANCNNENNPRYENWTNTRPLVLNAGNKVNIRTLLQIFCIGLDIVLKDIKFSSFSNIFVFLSLYLFNILVLDNQKYKIQSCLIHTLFIRLFIFC